MEVLVAMGMLATCLTAIFALSTSSIRRSDHAEKLLVATMLARQQMSDIEIDIGKGLAKGEFPDEKEAEDEFKDPFGDYRWKMQIRKVELPAPVTGEKGSIQDIVGKQLTKEIGQTVRELKLTVSWKERNADQSIEVVTHIVKL